MMKALQWWPEFMSLPSRLDKTRRRAIVPQLLACIGILFATSAQAVTINETVGGFSYDAPEHWQRIPNKHKQTKPNTMFDTLSCRQPKRIVIPSGWESKDAVSAIAATESLIRAQLGFTIDSGQSSRIYSTTGIKVTRIAYSTDSAETPNAITYAFKLPSGVWACYVCLVPAADRDTALEEYDSVLTSLRFLAPK